MCKEKEGNSLVSPEFKGNNREFFMPLKGQNLSETSIEQMKRSKQERLLKSFRWDIAEPYLDVEIKNGSANRVKPHITLREFKDRVISGQSLKDMEKEGISKHLVAFMSNFCQNKISLTKNVFERDYLYGKSLDEISAYHGVTRGDLTFLRQMYQVKRKGPKYIHRKKTEKPLTQRQREIIIGSLMGDAKKVSPSAVGFGHGGPQKKYLRWKYKEMKGVRSDGSLKETEYVDKRSGSKLLDCRFYTHANSDIEEIISMFYCGEDGCKEISQEVLDQLTPFSISVWYMDDGKTDHRSAQKKKHPDWDISSHYHFCTDSFSKESCERIVNWFDVKWGIKTHLQKRNKGWRIVVNVESNEAFVDLIKPNMLEMFGYKL